MAPPVQRNPTKMDDHPSLLWSISMRNMTGAGIPKRKGKKVGGVGVGVSLYDLVNRETGRAHRLTLTGHIASKSPVSISGASPYGDFRTSRLASFKDFNGKYMKMTQTWLKGSVEVTISDGKLPTDAKLASAEMDGWSKHLPFEVTQRGFTEIYYGDGKMSDPGGTWVQPEIPVPDPDRQRDNFRFGQMDGIRIPSDALFAFDSDVIAWKAQSALIDAGAFITEKRKERLKDGGRFKIMVVGHTDNIGSDEYNLGLSERRANAVAKWLINKQYLPANEIHTYGEGETKPIEPNQRPSDGKDNPYGREKNRRVEIIIM